MTKKFSLEQFGALSNVRFQKLFGLVQGSMLWGRLEKLYVIRNVWFASGGRYITTAKAIHTPTNARLKELKLGDRLKSDIEQWKEGTSDLAKADIHHSGSHGSWFLSGTVEFGNFVKSINNRMVDFDFLEREKTKESPNVFILAWVKKAELLKSEFDTTVSDISYCGIVVPMEILRAIVFKYKGKFYCLTRSTSTQEQDDKIKKFLNFSHACCSLSKYTTAPDPKPILGVELPIVDEAQFTQWLNTQAG